MNNIVCDDFKRKWRRHTFLENSWITLRRDHHMPGDLQNVTSHWTSKLRMRRKTYRSSLRSVWNSPTRE
jgi:hypothetical protein